MQGPESLIAMAKMHHRFGVRLFACFTVLLKALSTDLHVANRLSVEEVFERDRSWDRVANIV